MVQVYSLFRSKWTMMRRSYSQLRTCSYTNISLQTISNRAARIPPVTQLQVPNSNTGSSVDYRLISRKWYSSKSTANIQDTPLAEEEKGELIYTGESNKAVKMVKLFSLSTSVLGIALQPYIISQMTGTAAAVKFAVAVATGFFVLGTPALLHFMCKRYVIQMHYNKDTEVFTATRLNLFARPKHFSFKAIDISPSTPSPLSNFVVGDDAFLIDTDIIRENHPDVYIKFMRYDEPMDLSALRGPGEPKSK